MHVCAVIFFKYDNMHDINILYIKHYSKLTTESQQLHSAQQTVTMLSMTLKSSSSSHMIILIGGVDISKDGHQSRRRLKSTIEFYLCIIILQRLLS